MYRRGWPVFWIEVANKESEKVGRPAYEDYNVILAW